MSNLVWLSKRYNLCRHQSLTTSLTHGSHNNAKALMSVLMSTLLGGMLLLSGCATKPVYQQGSSSPSVQVNAYGVPNYYQVRSGETVSGIAQRYGVNYRQVGAINRLDSRYTIYAGQWLKLWEGAGSYQSAPSSSSYPQSQASPNPVAITRTVSRPADNYVATVKSTTGYGYPTTNPVIKNFDANAGVIGMWFSGRQGDRVIASKEGEVLYAGDGLTEYGNLIMIRHDQDYITAYAHNDTLLVKEGDQVRAGQQIATMGKTGKTEQVALQFQVRKNGSPIDPRAVLGLN